MDTHESLPSEPTAGAPLVTLPEPRTHEATTRRANECIKTHALMSLAIGLVPSTVLDVVGITAIELRMIGRLARIYGFPFPGRLAIAKVLIALLGSLPTAYLSVRLHSSLTGVLLYGVKAGLLSATGGASVYAVGKIFQKHFESGGTFLSRDHALIRDCFREQYEAAHVVSSKYRPSAPQPAGVSR
ncbi:MAG: DUF697 domain-containing protein [Acidobacteriota bacterium]